MSWFADLAGKAESLLNNLDEQTGTALRNHNGKKTRNDRKNDFPIYPDANNWNQKKRPAIRNPKKPPQVTETKSSFIPSRKTSPIQARSQIKESLDKSGAKFRKAQGKKSSQFHLNNCPKTLVDDVQGDGEMMDQYSLRDRRHSLPSDLELINGEGDWTLRMQNLEVENAMLKNELNVMNREVSDLLERLRRSEDGNNVDRHEELSKTRIKLENAELKNHKLNLDKDTITSQLELMKQKINEISHLEQTYQEEKRRLLTENNMLRDANNDLDDKNKELTAKLEQINLAHHKQDIDLKHSQLSKAELKIELEKSREECQRLERDWDTYKLRVKSMLHAKDNEIKALQEGVNLTEDTKVLVEQLESLKEERDELAEAISMVRGECASMKQFVAQMEARRDAAERVVAALRDALRDERAARARADTHCAALAKELKNMQTETGQTIASLRTALRDKETELTHLRETNSSIKTADTSALNVADYDVTHDTVESEKVQYLTETLVQRQARIDKLMAENNMLRIQLDKLDSRSRAAAPRTVSHSVVNLQGGRPRASAAGAVSQRLAAVMRRHPVLRLSVIIYMICLHFWVVTVLLTSSPFDNSLPRPAKS